MYHVTDCKRFTRCLHFYGQYLKSEPVYMERYVRLDETVTNLLIPYFDIEEYFLGQRNDPYERTKEALTQYEWFVKARFEHEQLRIKVPLMHRTENGFDVYFLWIGLYPLSNDVQYYQYHIWVLENEGIKINNIYVIHLNENYVRHKELDVKELFITSDAFYNKNRNQVKDIKETIYDTMPDFKEILDAMDHFDEATLKAPQRSQKCIGRNRCQYYENCFPEEEHLEDNSILNLISAQYKHQMLKEGITELKDAKVSLLEGSPQQYAQIMADRNGGLYVDQAGLRAWMKQIQYPITFIDFEWDRYAIPPYEGMKPFDVLPFEYSYHILEENGEVKHDVFLSTQDDRYEFIHSLEKDLPNKGSIIAYNAYGAESIRLQELANQFPVEKEALESIQNRLIDLQEPFVNGLVYDVRMKGLWSLKNIMAFVGDASYQDLDISHGMEAVYEWRHLDKGEQIENQEKIINDLKEYCGMDTYAMLIVYQWLLDLI